jgi:hypothetical protein
MRNIRRVFSIILALSMILCLFSVAAMADAVETAAEEPAAPVSADGTALVQPESGGL